MVLFYRLEIIEPTTLRVKLEEQGTRRILYLDTLKNIAKAEDGPAVQFLIKLHARGRASDTLSFQQIDIPPAHSNEAIRLMATTGRLTFRGQKVAVGQKRKVYWKGEGTLFSPLAGTEPLESAAILFSGSVPWVISGSEWAELDTSVPWKWLEFFRKGPAVLEGAKKRNFLEEEPPILWKEKMETPLQVFPQLFLTDATGSFANLSMHYPAVGTIAYEDLAPHVNGRTRLKKEEASWEKDLIESGYGRKAVGNSRYYCPGAQARTTLRFLLELGWSCFDASGRKIVLQTACQLHVAEQGERIEVSGQVKFQTGDAALSQAWEAAQKEKLFVPIDPTHVGLLELQLIPATLSVPKSRIGEILPLLQRSDVQWEASLKQAAEALQEGRGVEPLNIDQRFHGTLLPYQVTGVEWLMFLYRWRFGALLSDEMGLGKTVQVLAFFSQLRTNLPILIVAPTSLLFNWQKEIGRFWPEAKVYLHSGAERLSQLDGKQVILTSYALLRLDIDLFSHIEFEVVALDESQAIKTASSQTAQAACTLKARFRIAITGTPVENRPEELLSQFRFLLPDLLDTVHPETVRRKIKPFILRRKKSDVQLQLPEKIDQEVWIEMEGEQKAIYDRTIGAFQSGLLQKVQADGLQAHRMEVLEAILRLRQICVDPRLIGEEVKGAKIQQLALDLESLYAEGKKVLVFSQFTSLLQLVRRELMIEPLYLDGSTPAEERGEIVRRFQEEERPHVFLLSLKAGGVGLNLTAAESVILFDPWWNEAVERQAIDRAHRIGQKNTLLVHRYLAVHSIEEKMLSIKARKAQTAEALIGDETVSWTSEDLLHLLAH
jgi:superfamily II DNA or RNA helicase